jgi:sugar O-acyltransferase (sialic acid O-acetyltransferase NeuD family)
MSKAIFLRVVVIGAGGHAKVVTEAVRAMCGEVVGLIAPSPANPVVLGAAVLGGDEVLPDLRAQDLEAIVVALGNNRVRESVGDQVQRLGFALPTIVHPSALIPPSAQMGTGVVVMARAVVGTEVIIGGLAIVNTGAVIDHDNRLGTAAHVSPGCALAGNVCVGDRTLIGVGSAVRPGVRIGADVTVGAGSAVVSDVPDRASVGGTPARLLRQRVGT